MRARTRVSLRDRDERVAGVRATATAGADPEPEGDTPVLIGGKRSNLIYSRRRSTVGAPAGPPASLDRVEAATGHRGVEGDKAARIVDAMRASVARRGVAASTFDHVAREARVSRGLLHYYFGTKERLLAEVVRRDCELRMHVIDEQLADAEGADDVIDGLVASLKRY